MNNLKRMALAIQGSEWYKASKAPRGRRDPAVTQVLSLVDALAGLPDLRLREDRQRLAGWRWLESTRELQEKTFGYDFKLMRESGRAVCDYLTHMVFAGINELVEASYEFQWKRWTTEPPWFDRDAILAELVDASHFIGNAAVALGCTDEEWTRLYTAKQQKNRERQEAGYSGRRDKP